MTVSDNIFDVSSGDVSANEIINDVSGNDTISSGDIVTEPEVVTETQIQYMNGEYDAELLAEMQKTNYMLTALLFFIIFTWVQPKIHNMVKKVVSVNE